MKDATPPRVAEAAEAQLDRLRLITVEKVAELLAVSTRHVWRLVATGRLPAPVRLGRRSARWRPGDLESFIKEMK